MFHTLNFCCSLKPLGLLLLPDSTDTNLLHLPDFNIAGGQLLLILVRSGIRLLICSIHRTDLLLSRSKHSFVGFRL